jgi:N-methylhydantoinase A/oxoprolinase/acetone carboxylase beta subunit
VAPRRRLRLPQTGTVWLPEGPVPVPLYYRPNLTPGMVLAGPALVLEDHSTLLVLDGFQGEVLDRGHVLLRW